MILVTGGAGFIGSNVIKHLNKIGRTDILVVDDLTNGEKIYNLAELSIADYLDKFELVKALENSNFGLNIEAVFHQGACSNTQELNGKYMMENNYEYSKKLLHFSIARKIPFIYASSASVYGHGLDFIEDVKFERAVNPYAYSKFLFDQYVRNIGKTANQIVGLRYFNVFGQGELHKSTMASVIYHFYQQIKKQGFCELFEGTGGFGNGDQRRDFVFVDDVVKVNLWFWKHANISGIFNCGSGKATSFNEIAKVIIKHMGDGEIRYIPFPSKMEGSYQSYTLANLSKLRSSGFCADFMPIKESIPNYLKTLDKIQNSSVKIS